MRSSCKSPRMKTSVALAILLFILTATTHALGSGIRWEPGPIFYQTEVFPDDGLAEITGPSFLPVLLSKSESNREERTKLEEQLRVLLEELRVLEKDAKEKIQKEILPYLRREIEKLKEWLRDFQPRKEEPSEPLRTRV